MSHVSNHMVFNSATSCLNNSLFKGPVYTSAVVEINFLRRMYTSPVDSSKLLRVFGRKMSDVYIRQRSYRLKNEIKNGCIMKHF